MGQHDIRYNVLTYNIVFVEHNISYSNKSRTHYLTIVQSTPNALF